MLDRNIAEKMLLDEFNIYKNKDCRSGYTTYRATDLRGVVLHIGWLLNPIKVYIAENFGIGILTGYITVDELNEYFFGK